MSSNTPKGNGNQEGDLSDEAFDAVSGGEGLTVQLPDGGYDYANA